MSINGSWGKLENVLKHRTPPCWRYTALNYLSWILQIARSLAEQYLTQFFKLPNGKVLRVMCVTTSSLLFCSPLQGYLLAVRPKRNIGDGSASVHSSVILTLGSISLQSYPCWIHTRSKYLCMQLWQHVTPLQASCQDSTCIASISSQNPRFPHHQPPGSVGTAICGFWKRGPQSAPSTAWSLLMPALQSPPEHHSAAPTVFFGCLIEMRCRIFDLHCELPII